MCMCIRVHKKQWFFFRSDSVSLRCLPSTASVTHFNIMCVFPLMMEKWRYMAFFGLFPFAHFGYTLLAYNACGVFIIIIMTGEKNHKQIKWHIRVIINNAVFMKKICSCMCFFCKFFKQSHKVPRWNTAIIPSANGSNVYALQCFPPH